MCGATRAGGNQVAITQQKLVILFQSYILDLYKVAYLNSRKALLFTAQSVYLANMTAVQNLHAMTNLGPFHARVPRSRPLTTKGVCIPRLPKFV
jgi:hypothetical protein